MKIVDPLFEISTEIAPPKTFGVDGAEYKILTLEHLGPAEEARVLTLFAKHTRLSRRLDETRNAVQGERIALALRDARMDLITTLTDLPREVADKLPLSGQTTILQYVGREVGEDDEDDVAEGDVEEPDERDGPQDDDLS